MALEVTVWPHRGLVIFMALALAAVAVVDPVGTAMVVMQEVLVEVERAVHLLLVRFRLLVKMRHLILALAAAALAVRRLRYKLVALAARAL